METPFLIAQIINIILVAMLLLWPILSLIALFSLRKKPLSVETKTIWVLIILLIPVLGALAYYIIKPGT